jgi:hypothetical protein
MFGDWLVEHYGLIVFIYILLMLCLAIAYVIAAVTGNLNSVLF